jgi:hypothetical protein
VATLATDLRRGGRRYDLSTMKATREATWTPPPKARGRDGKLYPIHRPLRKLEPDARLIDLRGQGASLRELGEQYGVAHTTIWKYLRRPEAQP